MCSMALRLGLLRQLVSKGRPSCVPGPLVAGWRSRAISLGQLLSWPLFLLIHWYATRLVAFCSLVIVDASKFCQNGIACYCLMWWPRCSTSMCLKATFFLKRIRGDSTRDRWMMSCWGPSTGVRSGKEPRTATATTARRCSKFEKVVFGPNEAVCFNSWWRSCRRHEGFKCNFLWKISGESLLPGKMLQWGYLYEKSPDFIFVPVGVRDRTVEFVNFRQLWELQRSIWVVILQLFCGSQIPLTLSNCPISFPAQLMASTRLITASVQWYSWLKVIFLVMRHKCIKSKEVAKKHGKHGHRKQLRFHTVWPAGTVAVSVWKWMAVAEMHQTTWLLRLKFGHGGPGGQDIAKSDEFLGKWW